MPNAAGDLVTVLTLEDFEFRTGLRNAAGELEKFGSRARSAGSGAGAGMGRGIGQAAFAVQDFTSVLSMGGKNALSRALMSTMNNVQMLGMAFGPMGIAITAVAGALGSVLIPKLLEGDKAAEGFTDSIKAAVEEAKTASDRFADMAKFEMKVGHTSTTKGAQSIVDDLDLEEKIANDRKRRLTEVGRQLGEGLDNEGKIFVPKFAGPTMAGSR